MTVHQLARPSCADRARKCCQIGGAWPSTTTRDADGVTTVRYDPLPCDCGCHDTARAAIFGQRDPNEPLEVVFDPHRVARGLGK